MNKLTKLPTSPISPLGTFGTNVPYPAKKNKMELVKVVKDVPKVTLKAPF